MQPRTIETDRLTLRRAVSGEADALFDVYCGDPECAQFLTRGVHTSTAQTARFLEQWCSKAWGEQGASFAWVIAERSTNQPIGTFVVIAQADAAEVHFGIGKPYWGHGLVVEAGQAAIKLLFENNSLLKLSTICDVEHLRSQRVLEKLGFEKERLLKESLVIPAFGTLARHGIRYVKMSSDAQ